MKISKHTTHIYYILLSLLIVGSVFSSTKVLAVEDGFDMQSCMTKASEKYHYPQIFCDCARDVDISSAPIPELRRMALCGIKVLTYSNEIVPNPPMCEFVKSKKAAKVGDIVQQYWTYGLKGWKSGVNRDEKGVLWLVKEINHKGVVIEIIKGQINLSSRKIGEVGYTTLKHNSILFSRNYPKAKKSKQALRSFKVCKK